MMDQLMLLAKGRIIYFNHASLAVDYFSGINHRCPELSNPADYFMAIMSIETIEQERQEALATEKEYEGGKSVQEIYEQRISGFSNNYRNSNLFNNAELLAGKGVAPISSE